MVPGTASLANSQCGPHHQFKCLNYPIQQTRTQICTFRQHNPPTLRHQRVITQAKLVNNDSAASDNIAEDASETLQDIAPPKFQPFVAHNELRRRMMTYYREFTTKDGQTLVVQPVTEEWVEPSADLLAEAFGDSMGYTLYKNFLKRQIRNYLRAHMKLPPKTVVLAALLVDNNSPASSNSTTSTTTAVDMQNDFDSLESPELDETLAPSLHDFVDFEKKYEAGYGDGMGTASPWSSSSEEEVEGAATSPPPQSTMTSSGSSEAENALPASRPMPSNARLVGAVEVSFTESTRSKDWTGLNPPPERPYLCNMAVAKSVRQRGIGGLLLGAAEELVKLVGDNCVYLHLRFKDAPAAALYRKAGYAPAAQDSFFVILLGQDRRWLMKKEF